MNVPQNRIAALFSGKSFDIADFCRRMSDEDIARAEWDWARWRTDRQEVPVGDWRTWLVMAGRGFGKTRMGSEWVRDIAEGANGDTRIALVGATMAEVRAVMIEGESGLLSIGPPEKRPTWEPSLGRLTWPSGAQGLVYSAENPEKLRGPSHHFAWCDELAKWGYPQESWDNLQMGLRLGELPRSMVTTTPRPIALVRKLFADASVAKTFGGTADNMFLPDAFTDWVQDTYGGTRLGRQELNGELIDDVAGALWTRTMIEACRARVASEVKRVVIGVDPPAGIGGDACGIVVVALAGDGVAYVLEDASVGGLAPEGWAAAVADAAGRHNVDRVSIGGETVVVTNKGSGGWRELLSGAGVRSVSVSGAGVFTGSAAETRLKGNALSGVLDDFELSFESGERLQGRFLVNRLDYSGDFNGERSYTLALESSGQVLSL